MPKAAIRVSKRKGGLVPWLVNRSRRQSTRLRCPMQRRGRRLTPIPAISRGSVDHVSKVKPALLASGVSGAAAEAPACEIAATIDQGSSATVHKSP